MTELLNHDVRDEKEDGTTVEKMERHVPTRLETYCTERGLGDGQGDMG